METGTEQLVASVDEGIGWIVVNNPAKRNAMTAEMFAALSRVADAFAADPDVRVVVIRGEGDISFISGADIAQLDSGEIRSRGAAPGPMPDAAVGGHLGAIPKPVIAMINGYCLGGGVGVALAADIRVCAEHAQFGVPAAKLGVAYPFAAVAQLVALVGPGHAMEILYAGRRISGEEAARIGLVNRCVPGAELESVVRELAADIVANAPLSHAAHKLAVRAASVPGAHADLSAVHAASAAAWGSEDFVEGRRAFLERRPATFHGR